MTECGIENTAPRADDSVTALEQRFPAWWVWVSDTGTWWASHREQLTSAQLNAGRVQYLSAAAPEELNDLLAEQEAIGTENS